MMSTRQIKGGMWGRVKRHLQVSQTLYHIVHYFGHAFGQNSPVDQMIARGIWIVNILIVYQVGKLQISKSVGNRSVWAH